MMFTYDYLKQQYLAALANGYRVVTCAEYSEMKSSGTISGKLLVNRVDIDFSLIKTGPIMAIMKELDIRGTFFVRLHAPEYNPFSFENYRMLKRMGTEGHEIGYHSEVVDGANIWGEDPADCLRRDVAVLSLMLDIQVKGVASHGGRTGLNNLDFWRDHRPSDFGLLYEAYDRETAFNLFEESLYVSDSEWTSWKCYQHGRLRPADRRSLGEHSSDGHPVIYSLIHPDTYYTKHCYESDR
ncbi:MAG TPA: hypothetical protein VNJ04_09200 [Gemmatimonadaceae bacterium]|nr:hypothetical protein [Gemmatimonadaceae bacterium]